MFDTINSICLGCVITAVVVDVLFGICVLFRYLIKTSKKKLKNII